MKFSRVLLFAFASICVLAGCQSPSDPDALVSPASAATLDLKDVDRPPLTIETFPPNYPISLRESRTSGTVVITFIVNTQGKVVDPSVAHATHPAFGQAAVAAVSKWRYEPALKDGKPVNCRLRTPIVFSHE